MQDLSPYLFIHIGLIVRLLRHAQEFNIDTIVKESRTLTAKLDKASFTVSSAGLHELEQFIDELEKEDTQKCKLTEQESQTLSKVMAVVEKMIFAEAQTKKIYVLTETRFSLNSLMNKPWQMFAKKTPSRLSRIAKYDIAEGFQCIVLSRPTAAAFHLLRATEATLQAYYSQIVKRKRIKKPMWNSMLVHLRKRRKPDESLLQRLDYMRDTYRNPTSHPEARYTIEEFQDLLGLCIDVINSMAKSLPELKMPRPTTIPSPNRRESQ